jgi:hypothetical protein
MKKNNFERKTFSVIYKDIEIVKSEIIKNKKIVKIL